MFLVLSRSLRVPAGGRHYAPRTTDQRLGHIRCQARRDDKADVGGGDDSGVADDEEVVGSEERADSAGTADSRPTETASPSQ